MTGNARYPTLVALFSALLASACSGTTVDSQAASDYKLAGTIKDIMNAEIDPAANYIWNSIESEMTEAGTVEKGPKTQEDWRQERLRTITLAESGNLLLMPGRKVAQPGEHAANPQVELSPEQIEAAIGADRAKWTGFVRNFQDVVEKQMKMVDDRNVKGLNDLGSDLNKACEQCHKVYWYPNKGQAK